MKITKTLLTSVMCVIFAMLTVTSVFCAETEYIVFGEYPMTQVEETRQLKNADYDEDGDAVIGDEKYRRVPDGKEYSYFLYEPILWQRNGNTLIAVDVIDSQMYDEQEEKIKDFMGGIKYANSVTWEECSVRVWLNNDFSDTAFNDEEKGRISGEVRLLTVREAKEMNKEYLCKNSTDYAVALGIEPRTTEPGSGDTEWFLKDISPIISSAACTVKNNGKINTGMTVLVNEQGIGIVPCITLSDFSGLYSYTEQAASKKTEIYYPGGETIEVPEEQVASYVAKGWFTDKNDAMKKNGQEMKARFEASPLNSLYDWRLSTPSGKTPIIRIDAPKEGMTPGEAIAFIKPVMDTFYTGDTKDHMTVYAEFLYDKSVAPDLSTFSDTIGESIHDAAEACWSGWGNVVCSDGGMGRATSTWSNKYTVTLRLKINGDGNYTVERTNYINTLKRLVKEAQEYSDRPVGQLQYLRNYFGQNTVYDGSLFYNEPVSLVTEGVGVCGNYTNFTADFCKLIGIPCVVFTNDGQAHAWNGVYVEGKWYNLDNTGSSDKEYMRERFAEYMVNGDVYSFNPAGFPEEHNAENVSFLFDNYWKIDNLSAEDVLYVKNNFAQGYVKPQPPVTDKEISVILKGEKLVFDANPITENGRVLVPMRKIFEELGATVYWNNDTKTATGLKDSTVVTITVDSNIMTKNGQNISLDVPARISNTRTLVPIRVIAESFGLDVKWNQDTYSVVIK